MKIGVRSIAATVVCSNLTMATLLYRWNKQFTATSSKLVSLLDVDISSSTNSKSSEAGIKTTMI